MSIRTAQLSDADDVVRLTSQLGYDVAVADVAAKLSRILERSDQQLLIAETDGRAVGWLHAAVGEFLEAAPFVMIAGLVVDRDYRRRGIGRTLMARAEEWAMARGCGIVRLWSSSGRAAAHRFYEQLGYANIKTQYAFVKPLDDAARERLKTLVPRLGD